MKRLIEIQNALIARKDQKTEEEKRTYKYRTAEAILNKAKPLCKEQGLAIIMNDDILQIGDRYFLKSTVALYSDTGKLADATAMAELDNHEGTKKDGTAFKLMSKEQATGSASSYARKYALCALFAIDDAEQDPDDGFKDIKGLIEGAETIEVLQQVWNERGKSHPRRVELGAAVSKRKAELEKEIQEYTPPTPPSVKIGGNIVKPL